MAQACSKAGLWIFDPVIETHLAAGNEIPEELAAAPNGRAKAAQRQSPENGPPAALPPSASSSIAFVGLADTMGLRRGGLRFTFPAQSD